MLVDSGVKPQKTDEATNPLLIKFDMQKATAKPRRKNQNRNRPIKGRWATMRR